MRNNVSSLPSSILAALLMGAFASHALAEDKPPTEISFNAAVANDYRYRGISQTRLQPALQGGIDVVANPSGWYAGAWASTIKWTEDAGGTGNAELDLYGGKRGALAKDFGYDVGVLSYVYPGFARANTTELYGQLSYGVALIKYSHAVTNLFGVTDSKNSGYLDLQANPDLGNGVIANLHLGHQRVAHNTVSSYSDWKVGLSKDFGLVTGALAVIGTNADKVAYTSPANGKFLGKTALLLTVSKTF